MLSSLLLHVPMALAEQTSWEIPFKVEGCKIVVRGAIGDAEGLRFMVDTGTATSLVDKHVIRRLGLKAESQEGQLIGVNGVTKTKRVLLSDVRLGMISASFPCFEATLSEWGVDGVIGLDFLRRQTCQSNPRSGEILRNNQCTIDFGSRMIRFGQAPTLEYSAPMENDPYRIVVSARILGHSLRLLAGRHRGQPDNPL